jgi:hypothetical protein
MSLDYGFVKCKVVSQPVMKGFHRHRETQYHIHATLRVVDGGGMVKS